MLYIEAPNPVPVHDGFPLVFLAGGITGCPDWQQELRGLLEKQNPDLALLNPRRAEFPMDDPQAARQQITWEFNALRIAKVVSFWFCRETIQPIVLFELGATLERAKHSGGPTIVVGVDHGYEREQDVMVQIGLANPFIPTFSRTLTTLSCAILDAI